MAQYIPFSPAVEVNGETVLSVINALFDIGSKERMMKILKNNGIDNPLPGNWYKQCYWLNGFKEIENILGENTLFTIGKSIPDNAIFPPNINNLEQALLSIDIAYKTNHRNGEIGYYKLLKYDEKNHVAFMECKNPYASEFDRGIITTMLRKFKPKNSLICDVKLDLSYPSRLKGDNSCTYKIVW